MESTLTPLPSCPKNGGHLFALYKHEIDAEKARLKMQLHQAQKMEAIAELTTGIAQNFNNMLHGIMGNVDLEINLIIYLKKQD